MRTDIERALRFAATDAAEPRVPQARAFADSEYADRRAALCAAAHDAGIATLIITAPDTMSWLSGYESRWYRSGSSTATPPCQCIVLRSDSGQAFLIETGFHRQLAALCVLDDVRLIPGSSLTSEPGLGDFTRFLTDNLKREGWLGDRIGLEDYSWVPSPAVWSAITTALRASGSEPVDATVTIRGARRRKSAAEIAYIEQAQRCCDSGIRALQARAKPGITGLEAWRHYIDGVIEAGGEPAAIHESVFAGPPEPWAHLLSGHGRICEDEYFHADAAAAYRHYHARATRVLSFGPPAPELVTLTAIAGDALDVIHGHRAGDSFAALGKALRDYFADAGVPADAYFAGGYELGLSFAPDWVGELMWSSHDETNDELIPDGLVTNFESCLHVAIVDTIVFEPDGARTLSTLPTEVLRVGA